MSRATSSASSPVSAASATATQVRVYHARRMARACHTLAGEIREQTRAMSWMGRCAGQVAAWIVALGAAFYRAHADALAWWYGLPPDTAKPRSRPR